MGIVHIFSVQVQVRQEQSFNLSQDNKVSGVIGSLMSLLAYMNMFFWEKILIARFLNAEIAQDGSYAPMCSVGTT